MPVAVSSIIVDDPNTGANADTAAITRSKRKQAAETH